MAWQESVRRGREEELSRILDFGLGLIGIVTLVPEFQGVKILDCALLDLNKVGIINIALDV